MSKQKYVVKIEAAEWEKALDKSFKKNVEKQK